MNLQALSDDELWQLYEAQAWRPRDRRPDELNEAILSEIDRRAELSSRNDHRQTLKQNVGPAMTLQEAKSIARHLGLTLRRVRSGDYRVNFRDGNETTAFYTNDLEDAVNTAVEMARKRELSAWPKLDPHYGQSC
jgi:hypothetical protein